MNHIEPTLLWAMAVVILGVAFNAGINWYQTRMNTDAIKLLRKDLMTHMEQEQQERKVDKQDIVQRLDLLLERQAAISERVARLEP